MKPDASTPKANPRQYAQLRRKLSVSLALNWLVYTAVFLIVAVILNFTIIPRIADEIADSTSEWRVWYYDDYPLERCLEKTGYSFIGVASSIQEPSVLGDGSSGEAEGEAAEAIQEVAIISLEEMRASGEIDDEGDGQEPPLGEVVIDANTGETVLVVPDYPREDIGPFTTLLLRDDEEWNDVDPLPHYTTTTLRQLQQQTIESEAFNDLEFETFNNMQISYGDISMMARDLTTYNFIKQFKYPLAIALYLVGCIVLIFLSYGRVMKYFAELTNAVEEMLANKEKPVELSPELAGTQDELNSIRQASLADERAAKYAERRKDELVAYLAHDIKTPLTSIMGYLMLLDEAPDMPKEQRQRFVGTAAEKAQRLEVLMDEFFEITRYNLQAIPIERAHVDTRLLLAQVADEFFPDAQAKGIAIEVDAPDDETIYVDADKFARALGNIVRNAIAYADADSTVSIEAKIVDGQWVITVRNEGREISEAHLQSIFEKFYREDAARGTKSGGAGLGLAIAKEIVVAHGGTISAASHDGITTFTVSIPE